MADQIRNDNVKKGAEDTIEIAYSEEELAAQATLTQSEEPSDDDGNTLRSFKNEGVKKCLFAAACIYALFHFFLVFLKFTHPYAIYATHCFVALAFTFLYYPAKKGNGTAKVNVIDAICIALSLAIWAYVAINGQVLQTRIAYSQYNTFDSMVGLLSIILVLEATRRSMGIGLPIVTVCLIAYAFVGYKIPGVLAASKAYGFNRVMFNVYSLDGLFGSPIRMSATCIILLIVFGAYMKLLGTGDTIMDVATSAFGGSRGGPAKVAVVSSGAFGMMSGSSVGNVVGTGSFTIPLMKRAGYTPAFSGAVVAVASTGGQIMPPVMGTAAFILAELVGMPYVSVCVAAIIPAVLYYYCLIVSVDLEAGRLDLKRLDTSKLEKVSSIMKRKWYHFMPILTLIVTLAFKLSIGYCAIITILVMFFCSVVARDGKITFSVILKGLEQGAMSALSIVVCCACAGIAISVINLTGLGVKFTLLVQTLAGNSLFLALLFSCIAVLVLGMGLPTSAAYIVGASVLGGALTRLGLDKTIAHMFIFYTACLADITPPVCMAAYAAGNVAKAPAMKVGFTAVKLAPVAFLMPFFIAYNPAIIMQGSALAIVEVVVTAIIGIFFLAAALTGWAMGGKISLFVRLVWLAGGFMMVVPNLMSELLGVVILVIGVLLHGPAKKAIRQKLSREK